MPQCRNSRSRFPNRPLFFSAINTKSQDIILTGSQRRARHVTRRLRDWRGWTTSQTSNVKFLQMSKKWAIYAFHCFRYNIEFVKIQNKKYARGWGIRSPTISSESKKINCQIFQALPSCIFLQGRLHDGLTMGGKKLRWPNFQGFPGRRARHQCGHWVPHQRGGAWAARQDWRGWKAKSWYDHNHRAFLLNDDDHHSYLIIVTLIRWTMRTYSGWWRRRSTWRSVEIFSTSEINCHQKVLFYEEKKRESMKALQHMEMIDDEADMFGIRQVSSILKTDFSPRFVRIVDAALAEDYSLWTLPALAFFRQQKNMQLLEV